MSEPDKNPECHVPANLLLEAAHQIFSCGKSPLVLVLVEAVLEQHPDHAHALMMHRIYTESLSPTENDEA
jgi:hypothetical protein